jgi:multiple sugar transport system substrate-binding protein
MGPWTHDQDRRRAPGVLTAGPAFSRRALLAGGLTAGLLVPLAGCGSVAGGGDAGTLRFWNLFQGADGANLQTMIDAVRREVPGLRVDSTVLAWGAPYYTKLAMASAGGRAPDMAIMHLSRLAGYAPGGLLDAWDTDLLEEFGVTERDLPAAAWKRAQYHGELYALPLDTHPFIVFYNVDLAGEAGLLDPSGGLRPITSPDAFLDAGRKLAAATGTIGVAFGYQADTAQAWRLFYALYCQAAGEMDLTGRTAVVDRGAAAQVVDFVHRMLDGVIADPTAGYQTALSDFDAGRAGLIVSGEWELPGFQEAGFPIGAAPFPTLFGTPHNYADSHCFVLPHQDTVDRTRRRETHRAAAELLRQSLTWAEAGHIPAYAPVVADPAYAELTPQSSYAEAAQTAVYDPAAWFTGAGTNFEDQCSQALIKGFSGATSAQAAVTEMVDTINSMLATPDPEA